MRPRLATAHNGLPPTDDIEVVTHVRTPTSPGGDDFNRVDTPLTTTGCGREDNAPPILGRAIGGYDDGDGDGRGTMTDVYLPTRPGTFHHDDFVEMQRFFQG